MTNIAVIVLAAGFSRRFGAEDKLAADLNGKPVLSHTLEQASRIPFAQRLIIMKPGDAALRGLAEPAHFDIVEHARAKDGMGSSIAAGSRHLNDVDGVMIALGDMPFIADATYKVLIDTFSNENSKTIFAPAFERRRGHPVLFHRTHFGDLQALSGDAGAGVILASHANSLCTVAVNDPGVLLDIDKPSDLETRSD